MEKVFIVLHGNVRVRCNSPQKIRACQVRENLAADNDAMARATLPNIYDVVHFRDQHVRARGIDTGTVAAIAAAYAVVKTAKGREPVSATFVDAALSPIFCWRWTAGHVALIP